MYFFDIEDFLASNVIGCDNQDTRNNGDGWENIAMVARATSDAFLKAFGEWYLTTKTIQQGGYFTPPVSVITGCTIYDSYYTEIRNYKLDPRYDAFWVLAEDTNKMEGLTREIWDDYLALMGETMCKVKQLMMFLDGGNFEPFYPE